MNLSISLQKFVSFVFIFALVLQPLESEAKKKTKKKSKKLTAEQILKKVEKNTSPPYESVEMKMKTKEPDGSTKERLVRIKRMNKAEQKALVRLLAPSDLKGLALLTVNKGSDEDQWLYLPSSKRTRRIIGSNKKGRFLDSELSYEDMRISTYKAFDNNVVSQNKKVAVIESKAKGEDDSSYSRIKTWVSMKHFRVNKVEYYDKKGKHLKTMTFKGYKRYGKKFWRAKTVVVKNVQKKRSTNLVLKKVSLKKLNDGIFSISSLEGS